MVFVVKTVVDLRYMTVCLEKSITASKYGEVHYYIIEYHQFTLIRLLFNSNICYIYLI